MDAEGVVSGFTSWLAANDQDVVWARSIADAFTAAGGDGVVSTVADSALAVAVAAAGVTLSREDLTIGAAQVFGAAPTSGYADDPVNTSTGNFLDTEVDLGFPGGAGSLRLERTYNSLDLSEGAFGPGWSSVTEVRLRVGDDGATLVLPDGRELLFPRQGDGWDRAVGENRWLTREIDPERAGERLVVSGNDGSRWVFTVAGRWLSAGSGPGTRVDVEYDGDGALSRLVHERGRWVAVEWSGGRVVVAAASDGRRVEYEYDEGRLVAVSGPGGTRRYGWNPDGLLESVTDAAGVLEVRNTFDARRRVRTQASPFGRTTRYAYLPGRATVVSDTDGSRSNTWISDTRGRLVGVVDPLGRRQSMSYDAAGNLLAATGRDGTITAHAYDSRGRRTRTKTASGASITRTYDEFDRVVTVTAEADSITRYEYADETARSPSIVIDPEGGRTHLTWDAGLLIEVTDPEGVTVRLGYDSFGDLVTTTDADGNTARLLRDEAGRVVAAVSPSGARTEYRYTPTGQLASRRNPLGATWRYEYDGGGRLTGIVDPLGARTRMEHGEHGAVSRTVDPLGRVIGREFDDLGNVSAAILPDGTSWQFGYDALSRLTETTDPAGHLWRREYDADGGLSALIDPTGMRASVFTDPRTTAVSDGTVSSRTRFDPLGRPVATEAQDGSTALTVYDRCGRPVELVDEEGALTRLTRDAAGRIIEQTIPSGATTRFEYDRCGRLTAITDPAGARTTLEYDADGRHTRWTGPTGDTGWSEYDAAGRVTARHSPGRGTARYRYDLLGRVVWSRDSWHGTRRYRYDPAGQLIEAVNGVGGVTRYEYDERGRNTTIIDPLGGITRRVFDAADHAVAATDPLGRTTTAGYDPAGRQLWQQNPDGHRLSWTYDTSGRETSLSADGRLLSETRRDLSARQAVITDHTAPDGPIEHTLAWNRRDQLIRRTRNGHGLAWEYDADGNRTAMVGPDGARTRYERDSTGRVTAIEHPSLGRASFEYDAAGHLIASTAGGITQSWRHHDGYVTEHTTQTGSGTGSGAGRTRVIRDEDGRITRLDGPTGSVEYRYDHAQQLLETRTNTGTNAGAGTGASTFEYDAGGRLTRETGPDGRTSVHEYDAAGQLLATTRDDGSRIEYRYDGLGRRTHVTAADGSHRPYAWSPAGWLDTITDTTPHGTTTTALHVDTLGELASINGATTWWDTASYAPALLAVGETPILATPGGVTGIGDTWTGGSWRAERATNADDLWGVGPDTGLPPGITLPAGISITGSGGLAIAGLEWLGHRAYDPGTRGFLTVDPLDPITGAGWSGNPYSYAG
ncbi:type IV secretion protein Rhs, partial [Rathayibacter iranicus]